MIMKFLPIENIVYKTSLTEDEATERLYENIEYEYDMFYCKSKKSYIGKIDEQSFNIRRNIKYRNSFLPRISGTIINDSDSLTIKVKMQPHVFVFVWFSIWCIFSISFAGIAITQMFINSNFDSVIFISFGMLLFGYAIMMGGFKYESSLSKTDLKKIFQVEIIEE